MRHLPQRRAMMMKKDKSNEFSKVMTKPKAVSLKELAASLKLSPTTVSLVLNAAPTAGSIPIGTQDRIFEAARNLKYRPNHIARSLRAQRTHTIGVLIPEMSEGYSATVLSGVEEKLLEEGYFYFVVSHWHREELIEHHSRFFVERCVEGILAVDTPQHHQTFLPVVSISGHDETKGVTNIVLNHEQAGLLAVEHLVKLGHKKIAVIKGQSFSSDTEARWNAIRTAAAQCSIPIKETLVAQLVGTNPTPEPGYVATKELLAAKADFTALLAFNDISAIGAIRALNESGRRVPEDASVIGFDDIYAAEFHNPSLTTIRQPLKEMGCLGAEYLLKRIRENNDDDFPADVTVEPELIIRQSTAEVKN